MRLLNAINARWKHELALARHQARWFAEYANDLQLAMLLSEFTEPEEAGVLEV